MKTQAVNTPATQSKAAANNLARADMETEQGREFEDNRPVAIAQRKLQEAANNSPQVKQLKAYSEMANNHTHPQQLPAISPQIIQRAENRTGLPDNLKSGVENLSGFSMDDVKVHYNSEQPAQFQAHAYAQGTDIHVAPGQEKHIAHEAWHVVQQKQGRVEPTIQMKGEKNINDDPGLEKEADEMGERALSARPAHGNGIVQQKPVAGAVVQRVVYPDMPTMWAAVAPGIAQGTIDGIINQNAHLQQAYNDVEANMAVMDFVQTPGRQPEAESAAGGGGLYAINYGLRNTLRDPYDDDTRFVGAIIHEMMHVSAGQQFATNVAAGPLHVANMNLPAPIGVHAPGDPPGLTPNQVISADAQIITMDANWQNLRAEGNLDNVNGLLSRVQADTIVERIDYSSMGIEAMTHYDTTLTDILYYLISENATGSRTYQYASRMMQETNARRAAGVGAVAPLARAPLPPPPAVPAGNGGCCFITTACMQHKGLDDNCEELTVLRKFRDQYLWYKPNGPELFNIYYEYSPAILQGIRRRDDEDEILARLYKIIRQCVDAIKRGDNAFAYNTYCTMVMELKEEFIPEMEIDIPRD